MGRVTRYKKFNYKNLIPYGAKTKTKKNVMNKNKVFGDGDGWLSRCYENIKLEHIAQLKEIIMTICDKPHIAKRLVSTLVFCLLRFNGVTYNGTKETLDSIGCNDIRTATHWTNMLIYNDDPFLLLEEKRKYTTDDFYETFPEIKAEAMIFAEKRMKDKVINEKFEEVTGEKLEEGEEVRIERNCRRDLLVWGASYEKNKKRPYFDGHERADVFESRKEFIKLFDIKVKDFGYSQSIEGDRKVLESTIIRKEDETPYILMCHDESTFRCAESAPNRWVWRKKYCFFNKGKIELILKYPNED